MSNNHDMRSVRTRQALIDAMFKLLETNDFDHITINDICKEAAVSRTTFYLHFEDKYDLVIHCIGDLIEQAMPNGLEDDRMEEIFERILSIDEKYVKSIKNLIRYEGSREIQHKMDKNFVSYFVRYFEDKTSKGVHLKYPVYLLAEYHCGGINNLIRWWVINDFPIPRKVLIQAIMTQFYESCE